MIIEGAQIACAQRIIALEQAWMALNNLEDDLERLVREAWDSDPAPTVDRMAAVFEVNPNEMRRRLDELGLCAPTG